MKATALVPDRVPAIARALAGALVLAAAVGPGGTAAAVPTVPQSSPPVFQAEVALVAAPVFVTDGSGKAVGGLTADDFEVFDGGTRVPIVAFQAIDVDAPAVAAPTGAPAANLPVAVQAAAARQFLLLFDLQFSPASGILRARAAASRFVQESLAPTDLVAVATFGRAGLRMLTGFTSDRAYVARAIQGLGVVQALELGSDPLGLGAQTPSAGGDGLAAIADAEIAAQVAAMAAALLRDYQQRVRQFYLSMQDLAQALAPLRGRKQVVLFSGGQLQRAWAGGGANASPSELFGLNQQDPLTAIQLREAMEKLFARAGVTDVAIHTVDLQGIEGPVDVANWNARNAYRGEGALSLAALADNTGGRRIRATNDFARALREVDEVSRQYYVLAFQPADPAPTAERPRAVKVRVKRDGLRVSHRTAYVVPKPAPATDAAASRLAAAEAIAKGLTGGAVGLKLTAMPYRDRQGKSVVPMVLHVDGQTLAAEARGGQVPLQVYAYALAAGMVLDSGVLSATLDLAQLGDGLQREGLHVLATLAARPGATDLRFFVRVGASGATGALRHQMDVPAFVDGQARVSPPLGARSVPGKPVVRLETDARPPGEIPFRLGATPFLPDASPALAPRQARDLCVFVWPARGPAGALEVSGELERAGQDPVPLAVEGRPRVVSDPDGFDRYLVSVVAPAAPAGEYLLRLRFREPGGGASWVTTTTAALAE